MLTKRWGSLFHTAYHFWVQITRQYLLMSRYTMHSTLLCSQPSNVCRINSKKPMDTKYICHVDPQLLMMVHHVIILLGLIDNTILDGKTAISPWNSAFCRPFAGSSPQSFSGGLLDPATKMGPFFFFKIRWKNTEIAQEILIIVKQPVFQRFFVVVCPLRIPKGFQHKTTIIISSPHRILHGKVTNQRWRLVLSLNLCPYIHQ